MKAAGADALGAELACLLREGRVPEVMARLEPVLSQRIPFPTMERVANGLANVPYKHLAAFLLLVAAAHAEGGWVVVGQALANGGGSPARLTLARRVISLAQVWCASDILGERVAGGALLADLDGALVTLASWRDDPDRWVRRACGAGVHRWAKRVAGSDESGARRVLDFLAPVAGELETDAIKGIGWGIKTIGRHHPRLVVDWIIAQHHRRGRLSALMLQKATTYLSEDEHRRARSSGSA